MKRFLLWLVLSMLLCTAAFSETKMISEQTTLQEIMDMPVFSLCSSYLFDREVHSGRTALTLRQMQSRYAYFNPTASAEILNAMAMRIVQGTLTWIPLYTNEECEEDASLRDVGLFYFHGIPESPFAVICAGGGFEYVSSMTESFPHALYLSDLGYHVFALQYRTGAGKEKAYADLRKAISLIFKQAKAWNVNTEGYSLWGASAGAAMAAEVGDEPGTLPQPAVVVMQYMDISSWTENTPPTYACVGQQDELVSWEVMEQRLQEMDDVGIPTKLDIFPNLGHGFGIGFGTEAQEWIGEAVKFWNENRTNQR